MMAGVPHLRLFALAARLLRLRPPPSPPPSGWDARQAQVIAAPSRARLLVEGGPGTGKTAVACARVAHLAGEAGLPPDSIWMVSFTRTAIREIRDRIAATLGGNAGAIRVSTLDSLAWRLRPDPVEIGSYDESVARVLAWLRSGEAAGRLAPLRHVLLDEAHDIVGLRAELTLALIECLPAACGVTVFADDAQAIYGFAEGGRADEVPLTEQLRQAGWQDMALDTLFRSSSPRLAELFLHTRRRVLAPTGDPARHLARIHRDIRRAADGRSDGVPSDADTLVLYRRRAEVLAASQRLNQAGVAHRLRMSGLPVCVAPWIAAALPGAGEVVGRDAFLAQWHRHGAGTLPGAPEPAEAWALLMRVAGASGLLNLPRLRRRLAGSQPPVELCLPDAGMAGPVVGTIHASKGREAATIHLLLPGERRDGDPWEEARVAFVGATRARRRLLVGRAPPEPARRLASGRLYRLDERQPAAWVEFGREHDLALDGLASCQSALRALAAFPVAATLRRNGAIEIKQRRDGGIDTRQSRVGRLSAAALDDLADLAALLSSRRGGGPCGLPDSVEGLWLTGLRSVVDGDTFQLAPLLTGWPRVEFVPLRATLGRDG